MGAGRHAPIAGEDQAYVIAALLENPEPHDRKICPLVGPVEMNRTTSQRPSAAPSAASIRMSCMRVRLRIWSRSSSGAESIVIRSSCSVLRRSRTACARATRSTRRASTAPSLDFGMTVRRW